VELSKLQSYVGLYKNTETNLVFNIYLKNNRLAYELVGQEKGALSAINDFQFHIQNIAFIEFIVELSGEVNAFSFSQGEWIGRFIRIN
jgi:hypothetical protein